jgi:hypothetical protein
MPDAPFQCFLIGEPSNDEILKRQSNAAEHRDLVRFCATWMQPRDDFTKFRVDDLAADTRATRCSHREGEFAIITDKQGGSEKIGAHFSLAGLIGSQRGYVSSSRDTRTPRWPRSPQSRLARP